MAMKQRITACSLLLSLLVTAISIPAFAQAKNDKAPAPKGDKVELENDTLPTAPTGPEKPAAVGDEEQPKICRLFEPGSPEYDALCVVRPFDDTQQLQDSNVYAVQQMFVLRTTRLEVIPYYQTSLNDQFVSHFGPGIGLNFYMTNVLAVGANFNYFFNDDASFLREVRQSTRLAIPINQYLWNANLNFTYVPLFGKFAGFGDFIFQWDAYVVAGVGGISTRPEAVIDPNNRNFQYKVKVAFNVGVGLRVFFTRDFALFGELRDYIYGEDVEATVVAPAPVNGVIPGSNQDPSTWTDNGTHITNAIQAQFGLSIFFPFGFTYHQPK
jgi:outer membrane beta-barrel protein